MDNFTTVQELSWTLENIQGQQNTLRKKDITRFDSKFKESPLRSRTSGNLGSKPMYSRTRLIRQFAQFVTFSSVPAEFLPFVCISVRLIRHRLIRQSA